MIRRFSCVQGSGGTAINLSPGNMKHDWEQTGHIIIIKKHYGDVIMSAIASQITSLMIVYSTVYSGADQGKHQAVRHWPLLGEFPGDRWIPRIKGQ